ncbi:MAG: class D sortase [Bryobacteraceae bacterium]
MGPILQWAQRGLFAGAILMLGYCGFVLANTWMFQHREKQVLEHQASTLPLSLPAIGPDGLIGRIEIARLGVSAIIVEGTGARALRRATGHIVGTALPGQVGNVGISGHRDTFFRPLRNIRHGDMITLSTLRGEYNYRVLSTKVVSPSNVAVLNPNGHEILTLVTCYPFYFVGSAPERFIVRAERIQPEVAARLGGH